jgi:hypothetical protein
VFAEDFSADGKADSGSSSTFRGFEDVEDGGALIFRNSGAVITDSYEHEVCRSVVTSLNDNGAAFNSLDGIDGIGDDVEDSAVNSLGIEECCGNIVTGAEFDGNSGFCCASSGEFSDFGDNVVKFCGFECGNTFFAEAQHIHHEVIDASLVAFNDAPTLADE